MSVYRTGTVFRIAFLYAFTYNKEDDKCLIAFILRLRFCRLCNYIFISCLNYKFGGITVNPFEGEGMNCRRNQATDAAVGGAVSFIAFTIMFFTAVIIDFVSH